jgi:hypothetical protein
MRNNISILFWLLKSERNKAGSAPLMLRITYRGERKQVSTGKFVPTVKWNADRCMVKGTDDNARVNNSYIRDTTAQITGLFNDMIREGDVSLQHILDKVFANGTKSSTLRELITAHISNALYKISYISCQPKSLHHMPATLSFSKQFYLISSFI